MSYDQRIDGGARMRAAIYARISKDIEGTELGVTRQQDDCRREAERRGWDVVHVYTDNDVSATRSKVRPEYQKMLRDIRSGHIQAVVVWSIDRLTRTPRELEDVIDLADRHGLALANVGGNTDLSTPEGRVFARNLGAFARYETENQGKRLKRKFEQKAVAGEPHGYAPYGFTRVNVTDTDGNTIGTAKRDIVNDAQAIYVREAARRVLARESLRAVITDFNRRGIGGPKAGLWNSTILRQILLRPANAGLRQHRGIVIGKTNGEAIYPVETHEMLVALLRDPTRRNNLAGPGFKHLMSGLAVCGLCGGVMRRVTGKPFTDASGKTKNQPPAYGCKECFKVRRKQEPVDELITALIVARLSEPDAVGLFAVNNDEAARNARELVEAIDAKLDVAADQFAEDAITGTQLKRISTRLRAERATAEARLRAAQPATSLAGLAGGDVQAKWDVLPMDAQREVVDALMVAKINPAGSGKPFSPDDIDIRWRGMSEAT